MENINLIFGMNAGKIWRALDSNETLTKTQLIKETKLKENELFQAVGWLTKENKIKKEGEFYLLDQTNLSEKIENNARKISKLFENGRINIDKLENITKMDEESYNLALGWLAKEGILENDMITSSSESISKKLEIDNLKNENNLLNDDLEIRNLIIKHITDQLTSNQINIIQDTTKYHERKIEIDQKNCEILKQKNELNSKKLKIEDLKLELNNLNSDIDTRNIIIKQLTDQLTDKQTQFIENSNIIKKLRTNLKQKKNLVKIANEKLTDKLNMFSTLQDDIENEKIDMDNSKSTLFSKTDTIFNKKENDVSINNEIQRENIIHESDEISHSTLKNKKK